MDPHDSTQDHDLLIELKTSLNFIRGDIKELKDNLASRVTALEVDKIGRFEASKMQEESLTVHTDHEKRIRDIEKDADTLDKRQSNFQTKVVTWGAAAIVVIGIVEFGLSIYFKLH